MILLKMDIISALKDYSLGICLTLIIATFLTVLIMSRRTTFSFRNSLHTLCVTNTNSDVNDQSTTSCTATDDEKSGDTNIKLTEKTCSPRYPDPVDYCEHIQGEIKRVQQSVATKSIAKHLTEDQLKEEREVQRRQLEEIFKLMQEQQDRFGIGTMDDMQEQLKLYAM